MPLNPEDNQDDGNLIELPPDQYSIGDQRHEVVPYKSPLVPSSGNSQSQPTITSLGGVYTPQPNVSETEDDDVIDGEWRYSNNPPPPSAARTPGTPPQPVGEANPAGGAARRPFFVANPEAVRRNRREAADVELERYALREENRKRIADRVIKTLLVGALAFGSGAAVTKALQSISSSKAGIEASLGDAAKYDGTNLNSILGLKENAELEYLSVNPDWYRRPASVTDANGQLDPDRYKVITMDGREYPTGEAVIVGARTYYEFMGPDSRTWYMIMSPDGVSFAIARE